MVSNATSTGTNPAVRDVMVIGGGPAGAAAALLLARQGRDVVLLESTAYDRPRFGETLPPEINPLLRAFGVWDAFLASDPLASPGTVSAWGASEPREVHFIANRFGNGWHVDRNAFDAMFARAAADAGAEVHTETRVARCAREGDRWNVTVRGACSRTMRARLVIDASGRNGVRLDATDGRLIEDRLVAIFLRLTFEDGAPADRRTLIESVADGWWYCAPLPSGETVAAFFVDPTHYARDGIEVSDQLQRAPLTCERIGSARIAASHVLHVPSSVRRRAAGEGWASLGDAAASYDPLSGYGIVKALRDAGALADAVAAGSLEPYAADVARRFDAYTVQRRAFYAAETRWDDQLFWRRRLRRRVIPPAR